jgi:6,7-dimethyl-8-ribityllumazine synthase
VADAPKSFSIDPDLDGRGMRVAVAAARFNADITGRLVTGAVRQLEALGCAAADVFRVPGAFELPLAAQALARCGRYDAVVTLGAVVRGDTAHFDYVCRAVTDGVREVSLHESVPVTFGVLTVDDMEQALVRAAEPGEPGFNQGSHAAAAAVEMAQLMRRLAQPVQATGTRG